MRDDELRQLLRDRNPWWKLAATGRVPTLWTGADPTLTAAAATGISYDPVIIEDLAPGGLWIIRGPRRVGKSVAAKRLAARACEDARYGPHRLVYFSADGFRPQDLRRAFTLARSLTSLAGDHPRLWVIDEITSVSGWAAVLKELRDNTPLAFDAVVATGSSASSLDDARHSLGAGRTGVAEPFRLLLPMTFRSFMSLSAPQIPVPEAVTPDALQSDIARSGLTILEPFCDELDLSWQTFLDCGGFPRAVGEHLHIGAVTESFVFDLVSWLSADVDAAGPPESAVEFLDQLHARSGAPLGVTDLAQHMGMSRNWASLRLDRLFSTFGAFRCDRVDDSGRRVPGSQPKVYLIDPLVARLPAARDAAFAAPDATRLTEAALALELARSIDRLHPGRFVEQRAVGYTRSTTGREVDLAPMPISVAGIRGRSVPIESKWVSRGWRRDALTLAGKYRAGVFATKSIFDMTGDVWAVPAPALALLLN